MYHPSFEKLPVESLLALPSALGEHPILALKLQKTFSQRKSSFNFSFFVKNKIEQKYSIMSSSAPHTATFVLFTIRMQQASPLSNIYLQLLFFISDASTKQDVLFSTAY